MGEQLIDPGPNPEARVLARERRALMWRALRELTAEDRELIMRLYGFVEDPWSVAKLAKEAHRTPAQVRWWVIRVLAQLQSILTREGGR